MTKLALILIKHRAAIANMAMLYAGRTSGILVAFFFLPLYSRLLGAEQFGMVAVILSLQALLVMMDLGMSTLVSRDIAAGESNPSELLKLIRTAEICLSCFYFILLVGTSALKSMGGLPGVDLVTALAAVTLFWMLVLQNLYYSAMLARRLYTSASVIQVVGVVVRASATAFILKNGFANFPVFVATQLVLAAVHCGVTRHYSVSLLNLRSAFALKLSKPKLTDGISLLKRARSLVLFSAAGAAVMQLDKPLVTALVSATSVAPYFLATTFCMLPLSILAGPISQYFQPTLLNQLARHDYVNTRITLIRFTLTLLLTIGLPCIIFWFLRMPLIELWLGHSLENITVSRYVAILLPGCALGALGFIPYSLLLSEKDFRFQAMSSGILTIVTLSGAAIAAHFQSVEGVCYVYAGYHSISTLLSWIRAFFLRTISEAAKYSLLVTIKGFCLLILLVVVSNFFLP